jgi:hypothetical protein
MKTKIMVGLLMFVLVCVIFVAADGFLKTHSGDIILDPSGSDVGVDGRLSVGLSPDVKGIISANDYGGSGMSNLLFLQNSDKSMNFSVSTTGQIGHTGNLVLNPSGGNVKVGDSSNVSLEIHYDSSKYGRFYADDTGDAHIDSSGDDMEFGTKSGYGGYFLFYHGQEYGNCNYDSEIRLFGDGQNNYLTLKHNGYDASFSSTGPSGYGDILLDSSGGRVYVGSDKTYANAKNLSAKHIFMGNYSVGSWDAEDPYFDIKLLETIVSTVGDDSKAVWDLSGLVKKNSSGSVIQSVLHTEVAPETELVEAETFDGNRELVRQSTGRLVNSTWVDNGELLGYFIGVVKAQQKQIEELNQRVAKLESTCKL